MACNDSLRRLVLVLGDQLDRRSAAFDDFDAGRDAVWMAEVDHEATHVPCHKLRLAIFFSAMRHFRDELRDRDIAVHYHELQEDRRKDSGRTFAEVLAADCHRLKPEGLVVLEPGDWRVERELRDAADELGLPPDVRADRHFYCSRDEFRGWAEGRKTLVMETFYRHMRKRHDVLMRDDGEPIGERWNYDEDNRVTFGKAGPPDDLKRPRRFAPDAITEQVIALVERRYADHPGGCEHFDLPVTREQALAALRDFVQHRLKHFGTYEDAMWTGEPFVYHARLSASLNLHLLDPRKCVASAIEAYDKGEAPLNSVEGFVRQLIGWREFIRGIYWRHMPDYIEANALGCDEDAEVPACFWDGETDMRCVAESMRGVLDHGYAHHIQRLMVLGLYAMLLGVHPRRFHDWHMAMYLDAIDWVSLPNTLGMSQYGDGGIVGTKPYAASGNYVNRMSNYCAGCRYRHDRATGDDACPMTMLYWDFLARHRQRFTGNRRMTMQLKNLERKSDDELRAIRKQAQCLRRSVMKA